MQGRWRDEIRLWEDLLALEPSPQELAPLLRSPVTLGRATSTIKQRIQQRLQIARQNEQSAWMYEGAQRFIKYKDNAAARTQLQMLWTDVPYYGDPAGLTKIVGLPTTLNYEETIKKNSNSLGYLFVGIVAAAAGIVAAAGFVVASGSMIEGIITLMILTLILIGLVSVLIGAVGLTKVERIKRKARNTS